MTIDRTSNATQSQYLLSLIGKASFSMNQTQDQVASGLVSTDYTGYGNKTALMEATRTAVNKATAYQANTTIAVNQASLQDTQLSSLSDIANQLRQAMTQAVANNNGTTLMTEAQSIFDQVSQILNAKDANGNYIYGGDKDQTPPFNVTSLSQLAALPNVAAAFSNGTLKKSVAISDGQTVQLGILASDIGTGLMQTLKDIATFDAGPTGNFATSNTLSTAQSNFLTSELPTSISAANAVNSAAASNGFVYNQLQNSVAHQQSLQTLYTGFLSNVQDVDMPTAISQLNQDQVALQAAEKVASQLGQITLLNYLPATTATG